jgi:hypothetical protein
MKVRQNLYIDRSISDALEALAAAPGGNKSRLVNGALADWLERRGAKEIDVLFKDRLARMSKLLERIQRDNEVLRESLSLFVLYQLTVTAPLPEGDKIALAVGHDRFRSFVGQVGRQLNAGKPTLGFLLADGTIDDRR